MLRFACLVALASGLAVPAVAAVVIDPIAPIRRGVTVGITPFARAPATRRGRARALVQAMKPLSDGTGRMGITDTRGLISMASASGGAPAAWLDLRDQNVGLTTAPNATQTGLNAVAFHPNFNKDRTKPGFATLYTMHTTLPTAGTADWALGRGPVSHHNVLTEWTVEDPAAAIAQVATKREVMRVAQPYSDHGAGTIAFNPSAAPGTADYGKLYIGFGDGGGVGDPLNSAQDLSSPFGKILRIDPADPAGPATYSVPANNPLVGTAGARGEVWAYGLRNPQAFDWDSTGRMLITDIGQSRIEEVNEGFAGQNYGWPLREGSFARGAKTDPNIYDDPNPGTFLDRIAQYDHPEIEADGISTLVAIGGARLYEGTLLPALIGKVVLTDLVSGRVFYFDPNETGPLGATMRELFLTMDGLAVTMRGLEGYGGTQRVDLRLGLDEDGELYLLTKADGDIYRFVSTPVPEPATWLMLVAGFGLVGCALRRRRRVIA